MSSESKEMVLFQFLQEKIKLDELKKVRNTLYTHN